MRMGVFRNAASRNYLTVFTVLLLECARALNDTNVTSSTCELESLGDGLTEWQDGMDGSSVGVEWAYGNVCNSRHQCLGLSTNETEGDLMDPQLVPLEIQEELGVKFFVNKSFDVPFTLSVLWVSEEGFRKCKSEGGVVVSPDKPGHDITLDKRFLKTGNNYFIVDTNDPIIQCQFGLRLNVTIKTQECVGPGQPSLCWGRGRCVSGKGQPSFRCSCCHGYTGTYCDDIDSCASAPCQNGGTCVDIRNDASGARYKCKCPIGYYGKSCETRVTSICDVRPCNNGGVCEGNRTDYVCRCPLGFGGHHCEVDLNDCDPNPCVHGVCIDRVAGYQCFCPPGYGGENCDLSHDQCKDNPCRNGGYCVDKQDHYMCDCHRGFTGPDCSIKVDLCKPNPCQNAALCEDFGERYQCRCRPGFTGSHCEVNINECRSNPCMNLGTCIDEINGYQCLCMLAYMGRHCELPADIPRILEAKEQLVGPGYDLNNLYIVAGTLGGALLIAVMVLAGCYCRTINLSHLRRRHYQRHDSLEDCSHVDVSSAIKSRPTPDAIYYASNNTCNETNMNAPLIKSKKV